MAGVVAALAARLDRRMGEPAMTDLEKVPDAQGRDPWKRPANSAKVDLGRLASCLVRIWVATLRISQRVAEKIINEHHIEPQEVRDAVECVVGLAVSEDLDPERGWRVIVQVRIRGNEALVVLYPADDPIGDVWSLGSVYFTRR